MISFSNKTVATSAWVLAALALVQLLLVFTVLIRRPSSASPPASGKTVASSNPTHSAQLNQPTPTPTPLPPKQQVAGIEEAPIMDGEGSTPAPAPEATAEGATPSEVDVLIRRALAARDKGDMSGTLAGLRDAQKLYPDDPKIIAEFAKTYEQMGLVDKALAQWKRVMDAGEKAGDLYGVAAEKVKMGVTPTEPAGGRDEEGLQVGSTFGLVDMQKNYEIAKDDTERVTLRAGIKIRPNATVVPSKLNIQVMFYDLVNNTEVEPTDAKVTSEWLTTPVDWQQDGVEVLRVLYLPKPQAGGGPPPEKKYLGYIMRLYYENELQDVYADPVKLLKYFPPQLTLQKEIPQ